ncbi:MAG TPA: glycosyltransferase family 2 protein [Nocardioides sp.]|uniref:glycosyltransferase family 2 protein n=1 Tax=Nocardioides sp. TaxID=35761 RepID=UPI002F41AC0F
MILSVTTLKDSAANVEKWVRRNLAGGIDHMVVFLDGPQPEVEALLEGHPHVTAVMADADWYQGVHSQGLNARQVVNAAVTSRLLGGMPWADWLFHLDGDEVARIDRTQLDALDPDARAVRLQTLEAVGRLRPERDPTLFKRLCSRDELRVITALGELAKPSNMRYFRGHTRGKSGVRPRPDLALGVHHVLDLEGERVERAEAPGLHVLHYESPSGEEFVRKWMALLSSGASVGQRGHRAAVAAAIRTLSRLDLDDEDRRSFLHRLYERHCADDVDLLQRLGVLVEVDADALQRSVDSSPEAVRQLRLLLERARPVQKRGFRPRGAARDIGDLVARLQEGL